MKSIFSFIALSSLLLSITAFADRDSFKASNHLGHQAMYQFLETSRDIEEGLKSNDLNVKSKALIACLVAWEHSDGIYGFETASMFIEVWATNPTLLSSWFETNDSKKHRWFRSQSYMFAMLADWKGYKYAKDLRHRIVGAIKAVGEPTYSQQKFFAEYLGVLESIDFSEMQ